MLSDDQDELIDEIDVLYNGDLSEELFVMQYPLRPSDMPYGSHADLTSVMKSTESDNLKLIYSFDNKTKNFDSQFSSGAEFSQTLLGQKIDANTNYCIGVYKNNILYLNPVSNFVQFRNDFSHMEAADSLKKKKGQGVSTLTSSQVSSRRDSISGSNILSNSTNDSDPRWSHYRFYKQDTIQSHQIKDRLYFDDNLRLNKIDFVPDQDYFDFLFSNVNKEAVSNVKEGSYRSLMAQPLNIRLEFFMKKLHVTNFNKLKTFCEGKDKVSNSNVVTNEYFLEVTLKFARLVRNGNLILKSEIRYDPNSKSDMATKRNYVINLLQNNHEGLKRSEIKFLQVNEINEILSEIAQMRNGLYFLNESEDNNEMMMKCVKGYKTIYEREVNYWKSINLKTTHTVGSIIITDKNADRSVEKLDKLDKLDKFQPPNTKNTNVSNKTNNINKIPDQLIDSSKEDIKLHPKNEKSQNNNPKIEKLQTNNENSELVNGNGVNNIKVNVNINSTSLPSENNISNPTDRKFNSDLINSTIKSSFSSKVDCINFNSLVNTIITSFKLEDEDTIPALKQSLHEGINSLCFNINSTLFLREVGDKEVSDLRSALIEFLALRKSAKKAEIKSHLSSINISATDSLVNKVLKSIGFYSSSVWALKEANE